MLDCVQPLHIRMYVFFKAVFAKRLKHLRIQFTNTRSPLNAYPIFVLYLGAVFCSVYVLSHITLIMIPPTKCVI